MRHSQLVVLLLAVAVAACGFQGPRPEGEPSHDGSAVSRGECGAERIDCVLLRARENGALTESDWLELAPAIADLPKRATPQAERLLMFLSDDAVDVPHELAGDIAVALQGCGYPVPLDARPAAGDVQRIREENITGTSARFTALAEVVGASDRELIIGVLDSGTEVSLPQLADKLWHNAGETAGNGVDEDGNGKVDDVHGWNFLTDAGALNDLVQAPGEHGSHVLGVATRGTSQLRGMGVTISTGSFVEESLSAAIFPLAIDYAVAQGARVINLSQNMRDVIGAPVVEAMRRHPDVLFTVGAGNAGYAFRGELTKENEYVAAQGLANVVVVAASERDGSPASFSNRGPGVGLAARGARVLSVVPVVEQRLELDPVRVVGELQGAAFTSQSGTSQAAPWVANVAGKCLLLDPALDAEQVLAILRATSTPSAAWDGLVEAGGVIDEELALEVAALTALLRAGWLMHDAAAAIGIDGDRAAFALELAHDIVAGVAP